MVEPILTLTQVSRRLGVSTSTIRLYESEGFITITRHGRHTLLTPADVEMILVIERLRSDLGVNLPAVGVILEMRRKMTALRKRLDRLEAEFNHGATEPRPPSEEE
jgi:DNA-binding transcriptional MerR regulator